MCKFITNKILANSAMLAFRVYSDPQMPMSGAAVAVFFSVSKEIQKTQCFIIQGCGYYNRDGCHQCSNGKKNRNALSPNAEGVRGGAVGVDDRAQKA